MTPWSARLWGGGACLALGAWAAYMPIPTVEERPSWTSMVSIGIIGLTACTLVSIPGWVWLTQIGDVQGSFALRAAGLAIVPSVCAVGVAIVACRYLDRRMAVVGSWAAGALGLWVISGSL